MKQTTVNEFKDGLNLDLHPLVTPKTVLTDNINGTFITYNGNEFCLQNDRGNKWTTAKLTKGYTPIGIKEHNGILYIVSYNNEKQLTEIGTYPGIDWSSKEGVLDYSKYTVLNNGYDSIRYCIYSDYDDDSLLENHISIDWNEIESILRRYNYRSTGYIFMVMPPIEPYAYFSIKTVRDECYQELNTLYPNIFKTKEISTENAEEISYLPIRFQSNYGLNTPITIEVQDSYDGSVNLILVADGRKTRIINSGFSVQDNNKYKLIQRNQTVVTNYYNLNEFDKDSELIRTSNILTNIDLLGVQSGGQFKGGNYTFYIKFGDGDYNQTDVVAESGIVSIFNGNDGVPSTISGTLLDERTDKMINLEITGLNKIYSKIYIYYSREYSDTQGYRMTEYGMFKEPIDINPDNPLELDDSKRKQSIWLTGFEQTVPIDSELLNIDYHTIDWARAEAQHSNMLFLGNIGQKETFELYHDLETFTADPNNVTYNIGQDTLYDTTSGDPFSNGNYYSTSNIYYSLGYWPNEWYRFGIVYILDDGSTTPVFNMCGNINNNDKGVFKVPDFDVLSTNNPIYFKFELHNVSQLDSKVIGWFVVRQKRIPVTICQGITLATDKRAHVPMIWHGAVEENDKWVVESFLSLDRSKTEGEPWIHENGSAAIFQVEGATHILRPLLEITSNIENYNNYDYIIRIDAPAPPRSEDYNSNNPISGFDNVKSFIESKYSSTIAFIYQENVKEYLDNTMTDWHIVCQFEPIKYKVEDGKLIEQSGSLCYVMSDDDYNNWFNPDQVSSFSGTGGSFFIDSEGIFDINSETSNISKEKFRYIIEGETDVITNGILSLDPCINNTVGHILDGSEFTLQKEYNLTLKEQDNELVFDYGILELENKDGAESNIKAVFINNSKYKVLDDDNIFSTIAGSGNNAMDFAYSKKVFGVMTDANGKTRLYKKDPRVTDSYGTSDYYGYNSTHNVNLIRGIFTPFIGLNKEIDVGLYSIKQNLLNDTDNVNVRAQDNSEYYTITKRIKINKDNTSNSAIIYRGDCYICKVGMRILNNFIDSSAPVNSTIVDPLSWERWVRQRSLYGGDKQDNTFWDKDSDSYAALVDYSEVNLSDLNAVDLGYWAVFPCLSSYNLGLRSEDRFHTDEMALLGTPRSFYPLNGASCINRITDSHLLNDGLSATVGRKRYNLMPNVPYSKSEFANRIMFSNVNVTDDFTNGYRTFQGLSYKDYDKQYGAITKLISLGQNIFIVMEHGLGLVPVNPKALMQTTTGETIHIYGYGVLPDEMTIISQDYGSKYEHSVIRTPIGIYGIDVDAKKIWRFSDKQGFETISDMKIETYLKDYLEPVIIEMGKADIRTHYNGKKGDLIFTWNDSTGNKLYSICYNERQNIWTTTYDWKPIVSENINDEFYSLNFGNKPSETTYSENECGIWDHATDVGYYNEHVSQWYDKEHQFEFEFVVSDPVGINKMFDNLQIISNNVQPNEMEITIIGDDYMFNRKNIQAEDIEEIREEYDHNSQSTSDIHGNKETARLKTSPYGCYHFNNRLNQSVLTKWQPFKDIYKFGRRIGNIQYKDGLWFTQIEPLLDPKFNKEIRIRDKWAKIRIRYSGKDLAIITAIKTLINI